MTAAQTATQPSALFAGIYDAELPYVWRSLRRLGVPARDLEDIAHEVFLVVHRRLGEFDQARALRPWLFGISFRVASKYRRNYSHSREMLTEVDEPHVQAGIEEALVAKSDRDLVLAALEAIDLDRRAVFVMHELDDVAVPQIAQTLDIPLNTAYSRLRLAREEFSAAVKRLRLRGGDA